MPFITNTADKEKVDLFYEDYGEGQPVVLIHGWPLGRKVWEHQVWRLVQEGYRCISYDRRGFGASSAPWNGYDYDGLASDLHAIMTQLDLKEAILVGFSMGGGEVVRYFTNYGADRIAKAVLVSSIIPLVKQKDDNPNGVPLEVLDGIKEALWKDRVGFLKNFHKGFYNYDQLNGERVSAAQLDYDFAIASMASPRATVQAALSWMHTDFRPELHHMSVPTLIVHGAADQTVPMATASDQAAKGIKNNEYEVIPGAPHGLNVTHAKELNELLVAFFKKKG
ncbi:alpha/beta fold hydrolase [Maribacter sp. 2307ULW6-5]|uniref:alpha/beta fold hydrolase n=1 Tax=Maribacter sp. 2307ULW6-5 TaxID=3386275 RepID=UPI0039BC4696